MAAHGSADDGRFKQAFSSAIQRAVKRFKNRDEARYREICLYMMKQQVCARCVLRLFGHPTLEDYCLEVPSQQDMIAWLTAQQPAGKESSVEQGPAGVKRSPQPDGVEEPAAKRAHTDHQNGQAPSAAPSAAPSDASQPSPTSCTGTEPCRVCLGILQLLDGSISKAPVGPGAAQPQGAATSSKPLPDARPSTIAQALKASGLTFSQFGLDISIPPTSVTRELALYAHVLAKFGGNDVMTPWRPADITQLKHVARHYLSKPVSRALGVPCNEGQACDVTACLLFEHPASQPELVLVAQDKQRMQQQRQSGGRSGGRGGRGGRHGGRAPAAPQPQQQPSPEAAQAELDKIVASLDLDNTWNHLSNMPRHILEKHFSWPATTPTPASQLSLRVVRAPLLLAGRYLKLRRNMPHTLWCDPQTGERIGGVSLAEHIEAQILPVYGATSSKFISGGREDADVRMMGEGRPFVMEIIQPQRDHPPAEELRRIEEQLKAAGHGAQVVGLQPCSKQALDKIKETEETKEKTYLALCWCSRALSNADIATLKAVQNKVICQDTPVRVLHRRAPKVREKTVSVEDVQVVPNKPHYFKLTLKTQAGTYIKEFCHGDWGRTQPSLADILGGGVRVEILQLDVLAVHMDQWP